MTIERTSACLRSVAVGTVPLCSLCPHSLMADPPRALSGSVTGSGIHHTTFVCKRHF